MDGIERIAARIREDAEQEIARMNQAAGSGKRFLRGGAVRPMSAWSA